MRSFLTRGRRVFAAGGWILPAILLILPACTLDTRGLDSSPTFDPGEAPLSGAIKCDIPAVLMPEAGFPCATDDEIKAATADSEAPVRLLGVAGNNQLLDYSKDAFTQCGVGRPRLIPLRDAYPTGTTVCLNCGQLPGVYTDADAACKAQCRSMFAWDGDDGRGPATCDAFAKTSPNWVFSCKDGLCSTAGNPNVPFLDPRAATEPLVWKDADGVTISPDGSSIVFDGTNPSTIVDANGFRAGAASAQIIPEWDAMVEFEVGETDVTHVLSLRTSCADPASCPDTNPTTDDLPILINLHKSNNIFVLDKDLNTLFQSGAGEEYKAGDKFRIRVSDLHNGQAQISFWRVVPGGGETELFWDRDNLFTVSYPLRLDASFREATASINNVKIMRVIKK